MQTVQSTYKYQANALVFMKKKTRKKNLIPKGPWQNVSADFFGPMRDGTNWFVNTCDYSKWVSIAKSSEFLICTRPTMVRRFSPSTSYNWSNDMVTPSQGSDLLNKSHVVLYCSLFLHLVSIQVNNIQRLPHIRLKLKIRYEAYAEVL